MSQVRMRGKKEVTMHREIRETLRSEAGRQLLESGTLTCGAVVSVGAQKEALVFVGQHLELDFQFIPRSGGNAVCRRILRYDEVAGGFVPNFRVRHQPRKGFIHCKQTTCFVGGVLTMTPTSMVHHQLGKHHSKYDPQYPAMEYYRRFYQFVMRHLTDGDRYQSRYGTYWRATTVSTLHDEFRRRLKHREIIIPGTEQLERPPRRKHYGATSPHRSARDTTLSNGEISAKVRAFIKTRPDLRLDFRHA